MQLVFSVRSLFRCREEGIWIADWVGHFDVQLFIIAAQHTGRESMLLSSTRRASLWCGGKKWWMSVLFEPKQHHSPPVFGFWSFLTWQKKIPLFPVMHWLNKSYFCCQKIAIRLFQAFFPALKFRFMSFVVHSFWSEGTKVLEKTTLSEHLRYILEEIIWEAMN